MSQPSGSSPSGPTPAEIVATIDLLGDDHAPIVQAARATLLRWGDLALAALSEGAEADSVRIRSRCRAVLRALEVRDCLQGFAALRLGRGGRGPAMPLLEGALLLSQMVRTFVPEAGELTALLRREANELRVESSGRSLPTCARLLAERLHGRLGFRGGDASVLDLDHVLVDRVLVRRVGIPVSLSLIYLLVARWAGFSAVGVAMPDHFLVRLHGVRPVLVDPYNGGRTVTKTDCARHLRANGHDQVLDHLRDLADREVLVHYLRSVRRAARQRTMGETQRLLGRAQSLLETN